MGRLVALYVCLIVFGCLAISVWMMVRSINEDSARAVSYSQPCLDKHSSVYIQPDQIQACRLSRG